MTNKRGCMLSFLHPFRTWRIFFRLALGKPAFKPGSRKDRKYQAHLEALGEAEAKSDWWQYQGQYEQGFDEVDEQMEMEI